VPFRTTATKWISKFSLIYQVSALFGNRKFLVIMSDATLKIIVEYISTLVAVEKNMSPKQQPQNQQELSSS